MMLGMSVADESAVPHRPPQLGDMVEVRLVGKVVESSTDGSVRVLLAWDQVERSAIGPSEYVWKPAEQVAILRDIPTYQPGHADHP